MSAIAWAIVFYTVTTNTPTIGMVIFSGAMVMVCTLRDLTR